jgi:small GTP-binding protein
LVSEKFRHYRKSVGALLFYDITDRQTFEDTADWLREIHDHTEQGIVIMLIGNKSDLVEEDPTARKVSIEEATEFAKKYNLLFMETSAKTGNNVKEAFESLVESIGLMIVC